MCVCNIIQTFCICIYWYITVCNFETASNPNFSVTKTIAQIYIQNYYEARYIEVIYVP